MARVALDRVSKIYPDGTRAVNEMSLDVRDGEFMVLVGPSGCGKTTALRMLAGLETISEGSVSIGERVVNYVPSRDRDIAMVFQSYALYPHLTVYENIAFGLRLKKLPKDEILTISPRSRAIRISSKKDSTMSLASRLFSPTFSNMRSASSAFVRVTLSFTCAAWL